MAESYDLATDVADSLAAFRSTMGVPATTLWLPSFAKSLLTPRQMASQWPGVSVHFTTEEGYSAEQLVEVETWEEIRG